MNIWTFCRAQLSKSYKTAIIIVVETKGSSPGKVGFKMAVSENGALKGSVGGGSAEYEAVEKAKKLIAHDQPTPKLFRQVHTDDGPESSGMICAGEQSLIIFPFTQKALPTIEQLEDAEEKEHRNFLKITPAKFELAKHAELHTSPKTQIHSEKEWCYIEPVGFQNIVYVFGGGHVSVPLSRVLHNLGFYVKIFDNRSDISTLKSNQHAHEKHVIEFSNSGEQVEEGTNSYVIIMTVGHEHDLNILTQMANKKLRYLGMMGSKSKVSTIKNMLRKQKFAEKDIQKVHMPIGEPIHSHTPEEIAISIAAELIKIKNKPEN